jgi:pilus assembly protein CpaB
MARMQGLTLARGNRGLLIVAALAGLAAAVLFVVAVNQDSTTTSTGVGGGVTTAVVADGAIAYGEEITERMVKVRHDVPNDQLVDGALGDTSQVVGLRATAAIPNGEQITSARVGQGIETGEGITWVVPEGRRAVSIEVNEVTAVGGLLLPTDHVDVIARYKIKGVPGLDDNQYILRTETILQYVEVLAVAQENAVPGAAANADEDGDGIPDSRSKLPEDVAEQPSATTVTLTLKPDQAQGLLSAQGWAESIRLLARPPDDSEIVNLAPIDVIVTE